MRKKWIKRILWTIGFTIIILLAFGFVFYNRFVVSAPEVSYQPPKDLAEAQLQDLDYLSLYPELDRSWDTDKKVEDFLNGIEDLKDRLPVSLAVFEMEIAKLVALADNAHTNVSAAGRAKRMNAIPLRFHWFKEGLYIVMAKTEYNDLLGALVVTIEGQDPADLLEKLKPYRGGAETHLKYNSPLFLMSPEILHAIGLASSPDHLRIQCIDLSGNTFDMEVSASIEDKDVPGYTPEGWLVPKPEYKNSEWKNCIQTAAVSLPLMHLDRNVNHLFLDDKLYVQVNENWDTEESEVKPYLKSVIQDPEFKKLQKVILDLRFNPGGDYHMVRPFINAVKTELTTGQKLYVITGNGTFSAGLLTVAYAEDQLKEKAVIIGEPVGDNLQFWADGGLPLTLPNSEIKVHIWTAYHDWQNGCDDWKKCFWITIFDGVAVPSVQPDALVPLSFIDYLDGKDTALEYIKREE
ncbi:MAG: hypothetical protein KJO00_07200 [Bacteroidia bacterium]|nr:hypothetical protein [Bacteroidia bacterium]